MTSRGVQKQNSVMVTSSLTGVFRSIETRTELLALLRR
jgi:GTP cyclohydrolase I